MAVVPAFGRTSPYRLRTASEMADRFM